MRRLRASYALLIAVVLVSSACSGEQSEPGAGEAPAPTSGSAEGQLELAEIGPSVAASEYGAANGAGGEEPADPANLPERFEVLISLFDFDGRVAIGFSPFEVGSSSCLEARLETDALVPKVAVAPLTAGVDCSTFSPFVTSATGGELLHCSEVFFLLSDWPLSVLSEEGSSLLAAVTTPVRPEGVSWVGGTLLGPIDQTELPAVDIGPLNCDTSPSLSLSPDVPIYDDGVTQQIGIVERSDGGIQLSFTSLGDGAEERAREYLSLAAGWGEVLPSSPDRVELEHADGRYVVFAAYGGPGPMTFELCEWPTKPVPATCE